ncbi:co-chaperone DjlA [Alteromonas sediminis]|uniref:Co-chaperone protein DjlA n=1 Tax=Alteromonas sediminis TaxID=2259342 RepID=A0A3N5YLN0_9ALTE|nr:co-chaperone DjlA [Alteromonas sediminis]
MWGRILGVLFGFMFLKIPGAILGLIVGYLFDRAYSQDFSQLGGFGRFFTNPDSFQQNAVFFNSLFASLGHIAKADGRVTDSEIAVASALMDEMQLQGNARQEAQTAFREGKSADFPLIETLKSLVEFCHGRRDLLQIFLEILIQAALSDGALSPPEQKVLEKVAHVLGFSRGSLDFLIRAHIAQQRFRQGQHSQDSSTHTSQLPVKEAYQILGVSPSDDEKTVKKAYKKRMAEHHPDKLISKGLPQQALEMAKQKTQSIQAAYELIRKQKGW